MHGFRSAFPTHWFTFCLHTVLLLFCTPRTLYTWGSATWFLTVSAFSFLDPPHLHRTLLSAFLLLVLVDFTARTPAFLPPSPARRSHCHCITRAPPFFCFLPADGFCYTATTATTLSCAHLPRTAAATGFRTAVSFWFTVRGHGRCLLDGGRSVAIFTHLRARTCLPTTVSMPATTLRLPAPPAAAMRSVRAHATWTFLPAHTRTTYRFCSSCTTTTTTFCAFYVRSLPLPSGLLLVPSAHHTCTRHGCSPGFVLCTPLLPTFLAHHRPPARLLILDCSQFTHHTVATFPLPPPATCRFGVFVPFMRDFTTCYTAATLGFTLHTHTTCMLPHSILGSFAVPLSHCPTPHTFCLLLLHTYHSCLHHHLPFYMLHHTHTIAAFSVLVIPRYHSTTHTTTHSYSHSCYLPAHTHLSSVLRACLPPPTPPFYRS